MSVQIACRTTIGNRQNNEDTTVAQRITLSGADANGQYQQELALLGVFDGVGGQADGEVASRLAANALLALGPAFAESLRASGGEGATPALAEQFAGEWRRHAAEALTDATAHGYNAEMTTTAVAAILHGSSLLYWWLGDSRAYRFRDGKLQHLTSDHSTVAELQLAEEEARADPRSNQITRFLRSASSFLPDARGLDWQDGDVVLLVSDGVTGSLTSWELETFLAYWLISDISADELARRLLEHIAPNQTDNASVAVAINGAPRPLGNTYPQIPLASLLCYGLRQEVIDALVAYPASSKEWQSRDEPPWRKLAALADNVLNTSPLLPDDTTAGLVLDALNASGDHQSHPLADGATVLYRDGGFRSSSEDAASGTDPGVLFAVTQSEQGLRISSPQGASLHAFAIELVDALPARGLAFSLGQHVFTIRHAASPPIGGQIASIEPDTLSIRARTEETVLATYRSEEPNVTEQEFPLLEQSLTPAEQNYVTPHPEHDDA
ncbi:MAG: serine/threonine-protein phosphatase [Thermomicrobiales bacterium]